VHVIVDETGNGEAAVEIDTLRVSRSFGDDVGGRSRCDDAVAFDGNRIDEWSALVPGPDPAVDENQVREDQSRKRRQKRTPTEKRYVRGV